MAADILHTSVDISFSTTGAEGGLMWEKDDRTSEEDQQYLRLYPRTPDRLMVTTGQIVKKGSSIEKADDILLFTGNASINLKYPKAHSVSVEQLGSVYDVNGTPLNVSFVYNQAKNKVIASQACYGAVRVRYLASYTLYLYTYSGEPCAVGSSPEGLVYSGGYNTAVIIALDITPPASAQVTLAPDACGEQGDAQISDKDAGPINMVLEVHKDFPPRISSSSANNIGMSCKVRQIPDVVAHIDISSGQYNEEAFSSSVDTYDKNDDIGKTSNYSPVYTEFVTDLILFNLGFSAKLHYQPTSSVQIIDTGNFLDKWGNTISPTFASPGDEIIEVEWLSENTYANPRQRTVKADEIVALTTGNKTVQVYGTARVSYTIRYKVYNVQFAQTSANRPEDGFDTIHFLATYAKQATYLKIEPDSLKEK